MSQDHLITTEIKLSQCVRCGSYVFASQVAGLKTAVDPQPLDVAQYRAALIAGRTGYDLIELNGKPWKLHPRTVAHASTGRQILASHACGAHGMDSSAVAEVAPGPTSAPASGSTGPRVPAALSGAQATTQGFGPVSAVTPRPSRALRCATCRRPCTEPGSYVAIESGSFTWAQHVECS